MSMHSISAGLEADTFLALVKSGESADSIRATLLPSRDATASDRAFRRETLIRFEVGLFRRRRGMSRVLRNLIETELRAGLSHKAICAHLRMSSATISKVGKEIGATFLKRGRGRRFSPETRAQILEALRSGARPFDVRREFALSEWTVQNFRRELGDTRNLRYEPKLSPEQIAQGEALVRTGATWRGAAAELHVSPSTLLHWCRYRKRPTPYRLFTAAEKRAVLEAIKRGQGARQIALRLNRQQSSISVLMLRLRMKDPTLPQHAAPRTSVETKSAILAARAEGRSYANIGTQFHLTGSGVWGICRREGIEAHG
jgi:transposase